MVMGYRARYLLGYHIGYHVDLLLGPYGFWV